MSPREQLDVEGFALIPSVIDLREVKRLCERLAAILAEKLDPGVRVGGIRNLLELMPEVCELARRPLLRSVLAPEAFPVRGLFFDKTASANWRVPWHQDLFIAVSERRDVEGFESWSIKDGLVHVQPPLAVLNQMLTVRIHLDECGAENGPLRVLPGTHRAKHTADETRQWRDRVEPVTCIAQAGDALVMRPLILHASSPAEAPAHRRVIHLEFAMGELPGGLRWAVRKEPVPT